MVEVSSLMEHSDDLMVVRLDLEVCCLGGLVVVLFVVDLEGRLILEEDLCIADGLGEVLNLFSIQFFVGHLIQDLDHLVFPPLIDSLLHFFILHILLLKLLLILRLQ